jgi:hypothetical protein
MAKACFCGCGRKVPRFPLGLRSMNTRGRLVSDRLAWFEVVVGFDGMSENIREWVEEGYQLIGELRAAMHGSVDPRELESGPSSVWLKYGRWIDSCARAEGVPSLDSWLRSFGSGTVGAHPSPPEGGWPDEAEEGVDIDLLLGYWREHRHEYLDDEEESPEMAWITRPSNAPPTWAADVLGQHMMGRLIAVELADGSTLQGQLDDVAKDRSAVEIEAGEIVRVPSSEIVAYALAEEEIDHSDELRGDM